MPLKASSLLIPASPSANSLAARAHRLMWLLIMFLSAIVLKMKPVFTLGILTVSSAFCVTASAQQVIKVSQFAWSALSPPERDLIQKSHVVSMVPQDSFGLIWAHY